jgi:hypothetical protein
VIFGSDLIYGARLCEPQQKQCSAGFPACEFTGLSSPVFPERATGKSPEPADWKVCATWPAPGQLRILGLLRAALANPHCCGAGPRLGIRPALRQGINPYEYLKDLFIRWPAAKITQVKEFTPAAWTKACFQIAVGARVCDPQQLRQPARVRINESVLQIVRCCGSQSRAPQIKALPHRLPFDTSRAGEYHSASMDKGQTRAVNPPVESADTAVRVRIVKDVKAKK